MTFDEDKSVSTKEIDLKRKLEGSHNTTNSRQE